jgi:hypothetical protein
MKRRALAAAAAGTVVLTACSQTAPTSAPHAGTTPTTHAAVLVNCPQRYDAWQNGPAKRVVAALNAVESASTGDDIAAQTAALKKAAPAVATAARYHIPACADPKGYWDALLMHVNAAASSVNSAAGTTSIRPALKGVPHLQHELSAELRRTAEAK